MVAGRDPASRAGETDTQSRPLCGYRNNLAAHPIWQAWLRDTQPRTLALWGKYAPSFNVSEPEAYRRDLPNAVVQILEAGHFALVAAANEIAQHIREFMR
jgi:pimeloyl-ACP methyl ester carboxylesterase